jgi:hypothetical protein
MSGQFNAVKFFETFAAIIAEREKVSITVNVRRKEEVDDSALSAPKDRAGSYASESELRTVHGSRHRQNAHSSVKSTRAFAAG